MTHDDRDGHERVPEKASAPTLESMQAASTVAFHRWRARHPGMDLPELASSVFLAGFAAGACFGVKLAGEKDAAGD